MPAIQPARLKIQITHLAEKFNAPKEFVFALRELLDFYMDRTRRPGRGERRFSLTQAYNVPKQVMRQVEGNLAPRVAADPESALALADVLWQEKWLECRLLALDILGRIPPQPPERIVERIKAWGRECGEDPLLDASLARGLVGLWKESPRLFFRLLESWLTASDTTSRKVGLRVVPPLVSDPSFMNLPAIYNLISPFVQNVGLVPDADLLGVIRALAGRSPRETAYFLRQNLATVSQPGVAALVRQSLDAFPAEVEADLREFLRRAREGSKG